VSVIVIITFGTKCSSDKLAVRVPSFFLHTSSNPNKQEKEMMMMKKKKKNL
jgi:hypothetical protein